MHFDGQSVPSRLTDAEFLRCVAGPQAVTVRYDAAAVLEPEA